MMRSDQSIQQKNSRLCGWHNLLFLLLVLTGACKTEKKEIIVLWSDNKAKGVLIPQYLVDTIPKDSVNGYVKIRLQNDTATDILGDYIWDEGLIFEPLIPFTWKTDYAIFIKGKRAAQFEVEAAYRNDPSLVLASYPQSDTVPENLLKIYIQFSHPMREGESAKHIKLIKNGKDTLHDVFLDLQPELWNEDRTVITIWLDPGRVKRDLQPNLRLGAPLKEKETYELIVSKEWKDVEGKPLEKDYTRSFVTTQRDSLSPDPEKWTLHFGKTGSREPFLVEPDERLDHFLFMESLHITDNKGFAIKGKWEMAAEDQAAIFTPDQPWAKGSYILRIDSKLEDLAGNNLNRPFDRDITKTKQPSTKVYYTRQFVY